MLSKIKNHEFIPNRQQSTGALGVSRNNALGIPILKFGVTCNHRVALNHYTPEQLGTLREHGIKYDEDRDSHFTVHARDYFWVNICNFKRAGWCWSTKGEFPTSGYHGVMFDKYTTDRSKHDDIKDALLFEMARAIGQLEGAYQKTDMAPLLRHHLFKENIAELVQEAAAYATANHGIKTIHNAKPVLEGLIVSNL